MLYCSNEHPLFNQTAISRADLADCDLVYHPYRSITEKQPLQTRHSSGYCEQVEGCLTLILSAAHIGYLPVHIAAPWVAKGRLRALLPTEFGFSVQFHLATHRGRHPGDAQRALVEDLQQASATSK